MTTYPEPTAVRLSAEAQLVLEQATVAYMGLVEPGPGSTEETLPYVLPINFAHLVTAIGADHCRPNRPLPDDPQSAPPQSVDLRPNHGRLRVFFHGREGRKTRALALNPRVCLAITVDTAFSSGSSPCEDGYTYRSLLLWGRARPLESPEEREAGLRAVVAKYDPAAVDHDFSQHDLAQVQVYEVDVEKLSYKERRSA